MPAQRPFSACYLIVMTSLVSLLHNEVCVIPAAPATGGTSHGKCDAGPVRAVSVLAEIATVAGAPCGGDGGRLADRADVVPFRHSHRAAGVGDGDVHAEFLEGPHHPSARGCRNRPPCRPSPESRLSGLRAPCVPPVAIKRRVAAADARADRPSFLPRSQRLCWRPCRW